MQNEVEIIFIKFSDGNVKYFSDYIDAIKAQFKHEWNTGEHLKINRIKSSKSIN